MKTISKYILLLIITITQIPETLNAQIEVNISTLKNQNIQIEKVSFKDTLMLVSYIEKTLETLYQKGFESAYSFYEKSKNDTLQLWFIEGNTYNLTCSKIVYSDSISERLPKKITQSILSKNLTFQELHKLINTSLVYYENNGYPFAQIIIDSVTFNDFSGNAFLFIQANQSYNFDSIIVKGDAKISEPFIRQFFKLKKNEPYSEKKLKQVNALSKQISFLTLLKSPEVLFTESQCQTYFFVNKRKSHSFDGIIGFLPAADNSKSIKLTGDIKLKLNNLFAHGEQVSFDWRAYEANSQDMNIQASYPFLFSTPFGTEVIFKLNKKDSSYINRHYQLGLNYYFSGFDYLKGFYESTSSNTYSSISQSTMNIRSFNTSNYGIELSINRLNDPILATKGYRIKTSFAAGTIKRNAVTGNQNLEETSENQYVFHATIPVYVPLYKRLIFFTEIQSSYLNSSTFYDNEMFRFGGLKTLKGFDEDSFIASFYSTLTTELRFMLESYSYFSVFWNGAYYEKKGIEKNIYDTPWGLGLGIAFNTPAGIFTLNYAFGKQFNNPIDLRSSKIHFGITGNF